MKETTQPQSTALHSVPSAKDNSVTVRIPKPNVQVALLALIAFITLFQTVQLMRISAKAASTPAKVQPAATTGGSNPSGSNSDVPESMVGGC